MAGDGGQLIHGQVCQFVSGVDTVLRQGGDQIGIQALQVAQVLRDLFDAFFTGNFHGQQHVFGAGAQLVDGVFVKAFDFQHFLQGDISHLFQAGETLGDQDVGNLLVDVELFHEQGAQVIGFVGLFLRRFVGVHDVDLPTREVRSQTHVLTTTANGDGQVFFVNHHVHGVLFFVHHDRADVGGGQSANHELRGVFAPQHNVHPFAGQFVGDGIDTGAAHTDTGADGVDPLVVRNHGNFGA